MQYVAPTTTKAAAELLAKSRGRGHVLAGGTDLLVRMKSMLVEPELIIDIKHIKATTEIRKTTSGFTIGAAVPCAEIGEHKALAKMWPGVVEGAGLIGSDQIQSRCTIAGNLCNASPAADSVPALIAAGARAALVGPRGRRTVRVEDIPVAPGKTILKKGELIESIRLPLQARRSADAYLRFIPRTEMDIAVAGAAVNLSLERGRVAKARVVLGAVAPTAIVVPAAAQAIVGSRLEEAALVALAEACSAASRPIDDKRGTAAYRKHVVGVLARRAAKIAWQRAGGK